MFLVSLYVPFFCSFASCVDGIWLQGIIHVNDDYLWHDGYKTPCADVFVNKEGNLLYMPTLRIRK